MKNLMFTLLLSLSLFAGFSQNGGQASQNDAVKLTYVGKSGANYYARLTSKQDCYAWYKVSLNGNQSDVRVPAYGNTLINLGTHPPSNFVLKAKAATDCGCGDMGWVELKFAALPAAFKSIVFTRDPNNKNAGTVTVETADVVGVNHFALRGWIDPGNKVELMIQLPNDAQPNTKYSFKITDLKEIGKRLQLQPVQK